VPQLIELLKDEVRLDELLSKV
jgi:hypothetical protein